MRAVSQIFKDRILRNFFGVYFLLFSPFLLSAGNKTDSLLSALKTAGHDTAKIIIMNKLSYEFRKFNIDSALIYANRSLAIAEQSDEVNGNRKQVYILSCLNNAGACNAMKGKMENAFSLINRSLKISRQINDKISAAKALNSLGNVSIFISKLDDALMYYLESLSISESLRQPQDIANTAGNIGIVYSRLGQREKAIEYYLKSVDANNRSGNSSDNYEVFVNIGLLYGDLGNDSLNLLYHQKALPLFEKIGDRFGIARVYNNIALIYERKKDDKKALEYYFRAVELRKESGQKSGNAITYQNISLIYLNQGKYNEAIEYMNRSLEISEESKDYYLLKEIYQGLARAYSGLGNHRKAYEFMKLYSEAKDSVYNETSSRQIAEMQTRYETEKKENEILLLKSETEKKELLLQKRNLQMTGLAFLGCMFVVTGFLFFSRYKVKQSQQKEMAVIQTKQSERIRIARDMHDDIGAGLTRIALMSEQVKMGMKQGNKEKKVTENLNKLSDESRELTRNLGEIIWTMNPKNDTLDGLLAYIRNYTFDFFENAGTTCQVNFPGDIPATTVSPELRRNVFLIVKESLNNVVKHAGATNVEMNLRLENAAFSLMISDNGKGMIQTEKSLWGNGLANMKKRAEEIGGDYLCESTVGKGTTITLKNVKIENTTKV